MLQNRIYRGQVHKGHTYPGEHDPIVDDDLWPAYTIERKHKPGS